MASVSHTDSSAGSASDGARRWRLLAHDLADVTRAGARAAAPWRGRGQSDASDAATAEAMREALDAFPDARGTIVSGEGEKDDVPHLADGERFGSDAAVLDLDVAVDPIDGTSRLHAGLGDALCILAAAPAGTLFDPGPVFYMDKLVVGPAAASHVDPEMDTAERLAALSSALGKPVDDLSVFVLDKPRHAGLAEEIRDAGARALVHPSGDVDGAIRAVLPGTDIDALMGIGGTPEGLLGACAVRALGGAFFGRLAPQRDDEAARAASAGLSTERWHATADLVASEYVAFSATGITGGALLAGAHEDAGRWHTETLLAYAAPGDTACRFVRSR